MKGLFLRIFGSKAGTEHSSSDGAEVEYDRTIEQAWRDHFAPVVRGLGFKGSGRHFRRIEGDFVQTVNLQGSRYGGKFAVNLGLQPLGIPNVVGKDTDPKRITEVECAFRSRLADEGWDTWWEYGADPDTKDRAAKAAASLFLQCAPKFFLERMEFISSVSPSDADMGLLHYVAIALLREKQGNVDEARSFVKLAVQCASPHWVANSAARHLL